MIPTEKVVICRIFVCYVYNFFCLCFDYKWFYFVKEERLKTYIIAAIYRIHKINSSRHNSIVAYEIVHYIANSKQRRSRIRP